MGKPRLIILIRHAQSEGNKNRDIHQTVPDHRVKLTAEGQKQALEAGRKLRSLLRPDDTLHFFTSPYQRTRETTEGMLQSLTSDDPEPSPFPRHTIKVFEEPRLREQDFGNFQPSSAEMSRMWHERAEYGHFFYRIPNGESAADAYDRISGFNESLWRSFADDDFASVCVLVTHGLMTRVFLMKWYHWSVEYFEDLRNMNHCEFVVMQRSENSGKFILKNQLRTWTQWQREQAEAKEEKQRRLTIAKLIPPRTKWGANSDHDPSGFDKRNPIRRNTADLFRDDDADSVCSQTPEQNKLSKVKSMPASQTQPLEPREVSPHTAEAEADTQDEPATPSYPDPRIAILQTGRDGGGTLSGRESRVNSDSEDALPNSKDDIPTNGASGSTEKRSGSVISKAEHLTAEERNKQFNPPSSMRLALTGAFDADGSVRKTPMADALGDQSDMDEDDDELDEHDAETTRQKNEERSFGASVR